MKFEDNPKLPVNQPGFRDPATPFLVALALIGAVLLVLTFVIWPI